MQSEGFDFRCCETRGPHWPRHTDREGEDRTGLDRLWSSGCSREEQNSNDVLTLQLLHADSSAPNVTEEATCSRQSALKEKQPQASSTVTVTVSVPR
ncbi:uncharacterized protein V6R79_011115 [Siganus canaliculatus]